MSDSDRRSFLKRSVTAVSALAVTGCAPGSEPGSEAVEGSDASTSAALPPTTLEAVGEVVLPPELPPEERQQVVAGFRDWLAGFRPVVEQNHGYGTSEIDYGPPDPAPAYRAQLLALDLEAQRRHGSDFAALAPEPREALLRRSLEGVAGTGMPNPLTAEHVALALMARYYDSAAALDRCYGVGIARYACRGLSGMTDRPAPLEGV